MTEKGVVITQKEIYEALKTTASKVDNLALRMERIETKLEKQESERKKFRSKLIIQLISLVIIPMILAVLIFVIREGGF